MTRKLLIIIVVLVLILIGVGVAYWYLFMRVPSVSVSPGTTSGALPSGFTPFGRVPPNNRGVASTTSAAGGNRPATKGNLAAKPPVLRLISNTPVGGYGVSYVETRSKQSTTTSLTSTTTVRWIDRGRGNVYEANDRNLNTITLSNTLLPRIYDSVWNKNLTAFIGSLLSEGGNDITTVYSELRKPSIAKMATSSSNHSSASLAPFELKGKSLPSNIVAYAVSPKGDTLFIFTIESGRGVGYIANFDGSATKTLFDTPLTKINVSWPEENTIAIETKPTAGQNGFLYFVSPKTGVWKKILGPIPGLSATVSRDAKYIIYSMSSAISPGLKTAIYSVAKNTPVDAVVKTIADKCVWANVFKEMVYCAAPSQIPEAVYPDDWYLGAVSFTDKIWQISAATGEIRAVSSITDRADRLIDVFNPGIDDKDNYLYFMNKNDLSLWSLDLISSN